MTKKNKSDLALNFSHQVGLMYSDPKRMHYYLAGFIVGGIVGLLVGFFLGVVLT